MMKKINNYIILSLLTIMFSGSIKCIHSRPQYRPPGNGIFPVSESVKKSGQDTVTEPAGALTLSKAIELALMKNPELSVYSLEIRALEARALQASLLPNPEIEIEIADVASFEKNETTIWFGQLIELWGKIEKRTKVAMLESDLAARDYETKKMDILTEVVKAFLHVISSQELLELNVELVTLSEKFLETISKRIKAGKASPAELSRAQLELSIFRIELEKLRNELNAARNSLSVTWGSNDPKFKTATGKLSILQTLPALEKLKPLVTQDPEIARLNVEIEHRKANLELQKAGRIPDLMISGGYSRSNETGENLFLFGASIPIPVFDRNQGAIEEAEISLEQIKKNRQVISVKIYNKFSKLYNTLLSAHKELITLKNIALPEAENAYKLIDRYFILGRYSFLDVLDARRTLFEVKARYLTALRDYNICIADIERIIGQRLDKVK